MSEQKKDGGPAFPNQSVDPEKVRSLILYDRGMTLRDWFAGQALNGICGQQNEPDDYAREAYAIADSMLATRSKGQTDG
jgi:hypothetical protein